MDVTLLNERTLPDVPGNVLHGVGAKSSVMERYWKTAIIEEKWLQKRKQEPDERRLQKKRRELTSEEGKAPDFQSLPNSITNFDEALLKLEVLLVALNFDKLMVARGLEKCADNDAQGFSEHRSVDAKHCGELPGDQCSWLVATLRLNCVNSGWVPVARARTVGHQEIRKLVLEYVGVRSSVRTQQTLADLGGLLADAADLGGPWRTSADLGGHCGALSFRHHQEKCLATWS